ncbi:ABC transporter substrate-binding protein [Acidiphilium sp. AL]|uniref:ABC transporter substrate-binding protein n=1 Tax=Acidiphilium iwatense TaxID=768198 RepID=A0ABS9E578_9PROT|nr:MULTISPECIES: ABC transporter substrate-binding protein [Acidiphilium]MCF3948777.1 ABC transporter substrate-binding protein [Acidiphilium iwatense]MCU4162186.1 ABC transporter substrate-binding protein [Acidiphilium sp. AL]
MKTPKIASIALAAMSVVGGLSAPAIAQAAVKGHYGGTLRMVASAAAGTLDPQINYTLRFWQILPMFYDGLVGFEKAGGKAAFKIVPDLATSMPKITNSGKTYIFTLRKDIKFSNGQPVTVQAVRHSFVRLFKVLNPNVGTWYDVIAGGRHCVKSPSTCTLPGVAIDPKTNTVTFHLRHPDAEFLDQLAVPFGSILPANTPDKDMGTVYIPGTGAYMVKKYEPSTEMVMVRNPYFRQWSKLAQPKGYPNKIVYRFGLTPNAQVTAVENNQYDWMYNPIPLDRLQQIAAQYKSRLEIHPLLAFWYAPMNTRMKPFNNLDARLAVSYAINRADLVKLFGGPALATPTCQILPPGMAGYKPYCLFTKNPGTKWTAPDMAKAMMYMKKSGMAGQKVTIITQNADPNHAVGIYLQSVLDKLGFNAKVKGISSNLQFTYIQNSNNHVQISVTVWYQDYPAPSDFLKVLFGCTSFHPGSDNSINISAFCNDKIQKQMDAAEILSIKHPKQADKMWTKIDQQITDLAPAAPLFNPKHVDFVSARLHHFVFSGQTYFVPDLAWVH